MPLTRYVLQDDIVEAKSARLMKNKEDIDVQSTYHEDEIKGTVRLLFVRME